MSVAEDFRVRRSDFLATALAAATVPSGRSMLRLDAFPAGHDIDPYRDPEYGVDEIAWLYADGLVGWENGPVPLLAEALPEVADGGRRYRYRLRKARWHDGENLSSRDVLAAFGAIREGFWGTFEPYRSVREIVRTGDRSFDVVLQRPYAGFVRSFFGPYGSFALPLLRSATASLPVGTGPFAVRDRHDISSWRLESFADSPRGRARVDRIELRYLYSRQTELIGLEAGECDIALPLPGDFQASPSFRRLRRTTGTTVMMFNFDGPFGDYRVRRALAKVLDVATLQRRYDRGRTSLLASLRLDGGNDARLASALAHDSKFVEELRRRLGGHEIRIMTLPGTSVDSAMEFVRQTLVNDVGLSVQMIATPYGELFGPMSPLRRGEFDLAVNSYAYADDADLAADWSCAFRVPNGGNFARWCDPAFERSIASGNRGAAFRRLYDRLAAIPLSRAYEDIGVGRRVCDVPAPTTLVPMTYTCTAWRFC